MIYAHTLTYPEVTASKEAVVNLQGIMIGGPDRKMIDEWSKWVAWQKAIQSASQKPGVVPKRVMDYFQATKSLTKPPTSALPAEDAQIITAPPFNIVSPGLTILNAEPEPLMSFTPPRFTWSWSQYNSFLTCPNKWLAEKYFKTIPYVESEAMRVGNMVHETAEHYVKSKTGQSFKPNLIHGQYLPMVQRYCDALVTAHLNGAEIHVEKEMCFTDKFKFCGWWDNNIVWYRGKADVLVLKDNKITVWDYKTGAHKPEFMQLKMMCAFAALYFPQAELFDGRLIFTKHNKVEALDKPLTRAELKPILQEIIANVRRMEDTWEHGEAPARKNGLCRQYCGHPTCPHAGG